MSNTGFPSLGAQNWPMPRVRHPAAQPLSPDTQFTPLGTLQGDLDQIVAELNDIRNLVNSQIVIENQAGFGPFQASAVGIIATFAVPFAYNSIQVSALGGIVCVSENDITPDLHQFSLASGTQLPPRYLAAFGGYAFVGDNSTANNGTQIPNYPGPQQIKFATRPANSILTLWVHPFSLQPASIDLIASPVEVAGLVMMIP